MKTTRSFLTLLFAVFCSATMLAQANKAFPDYLSVPGPIAFNNKSYNLAWTSHPTDNYYKQEYLIKGESPEKFKSMLLLEVIVAITPVKEIVAGKIAELKKMKASNPIINYEMFQKDGEYILDFLLSANAPDGSASVIERNIYRYKSFTDKSGKKGVVLLAISTRAYEKEVDKFLVNLKANKSILVNAVAAFNIPAISIKK